MVSIRVQEILLTCKRTQGYINSISDISEMRNQIIQQEAMNSWFALDHRRLSRISVEEVERSIGILQNREKIPGYLGYEIRIAKRKNGLGSRWGVEEKRSAAT